MSVCTRGLADDVLLAWWAGELDPAGQRRVERHLMTCADCAGRAALLPAAAEGVRALVRSGRLPGALAPVVVERLRRDGRRIREYRVAPGGSVQCTLGPEDDVLLARLGADLAGVTRVDLVTRVDDGPEQRFPDLPFDPAADELVVAPPVDLVRSRPAFVERMRLVSVEPHGERLLGEYTFDHTPWPGKTSHSP